MSRSNQNLKLVSSQDKNKLHIFEEIRNFLPTLSNFIAAKILTEKVGCIFGKFDGNSQFFSYCLRLLGPISTTGFSDINQKPKFCHAVNFIG